MHLKPFTERLTKPCSKIEIAQRETFIEIVKKLRISRALSISCGDGVWDFLLFQNNQEVREIVATDIVMCPVDESGQKKLWELGQWRFEQVSPAGRLPFPNSSFDFVFHQDVIEHVNKPNSFLSEQYRVLKTGGVILCGTPNLFRPANIIRLLSGRLQFPVKIGWNVELGDYIHVQEFYEQQLKLLFEEVGFRNVQVKYCYFGLSVTNICFSMHPENGIAKQMSHFLVLSGEK